MDKRIFTQRKSKLKRRGDLRKPFPNRWDNARTLSKCCDSEPIELSIETPILCKACNQVATFRKVI